MSSECRTTSFIRSLLLANLSISLQSSSCNCLCVYGKFENVEMHGFFSVAFSNQVTISIQHFCNSFSSFSSICITDRFHVLGFRSTMKVQHTVRRKLPARVSGKLDEASRAHVHVTRYLLADDENTLRRGYISTTRLDISTFPPAAVCSTLTIESWDTSAVSDGVE